MQVAIEIRVEPKPRAYRPIVSVRFRNGSAAEDPPRAAIFIRDLQQRIPGEPAPRFKLRSNARVVTDNRNQIARPASAQDGDQLRQQTRGEILSPNIQIEISPHRIEDSTARRLTGMSPTQANLGLEWATNLRIGPVRDLLRRHPFVRACQLNCNVRNKNVQGLAVGSAEMLG